MPAVLVRGAATDVFCLASEVCGFETACLVVAADVALIGVNGFFEAVVDGRALDAAVVGLLAPLEGVLGF